MLKSILIVFMAIVVALPFQVNSVTEVAVSKFTDLQGDRYHCGIHGDYQFIEIAATLVLVLLGGRFKEPKNRAVEVKHIFKFDDSTLVQTTNVRVLERLWSNVNSKNIMNAMQSLTNSGFYGQVDDIVAPRQLWEPESNKVKLSYQIKRVISLKADSVYEISVAEKKYAAISLHEFQVLLEHQLFEETEKLTKRYEKESKPYKKRSKKRRDLRLRKYGHWGNRFDWSVDTINPDGSIKADNQFEFVHMRKSGKVKKAEKDTLFYDHRLVSADSFPQLEALNAFYANPSVGLEQGQFLREMILRYHKKTEYGSYTIDSTTMDFMRPPSGVPLASIFQTKLNDRNRRGRLFSPGHVKFADEEVTVDQNKIDHLETSRVSIITSARETAVDIDSLAVIPADYVEVEFKRKNLLRFIE